MIYFLHGNDVNKGRAKAGGLVADLLKKKPDASFLRIDMQNWNESLLDESIGGQGLFVSKNIIMLDRLCEKKEIKEQFLERIKEIGESENIFIILEGKLDKATVAKIEKKSEKTQEFILTEKKKEEYNAFALADAFGKRDRKTAWVLYRKAIDKGEAPEALHGMMFWKVKTMIMNSTTFNSGGAYTKDELYDLSDKLITVYHEARRGRHELETGVETLILSL